MNLKRNNKFERLCIKAITGNISPGEEKILNNYLSGSEINKKEFEKIKSVWNKSEIRETPEFPDAENEWFELNARIRAYESGAGAGKGSNQKSRSKFLIGLKPAVAAAALIIILAAVAWVLWNQQTFKPEIKFISTGNKEHKEIKLSDGSHVLLNSGSTIQFPRSFGSEERRITLKGEGFFSVAKEVRPFIITTDNAVIKVLGTQFNVRSRDGKTQVYVKNGKVNLARTKLNKTGVVLTKGELSTVVQNGVPSLPINADPDPQIGWIERKLVFNRTPLPEIAEEMQRFYDVQIRLEDNSLKTYSLTGSFKDNGIENVLRMICLALDLDYSKAPGSANQNSGQSGYIIKQKNSPGRF